MENKFKRITLDEAHEGYYPKPEGIPCSTADAYTLTTDPSDPAWSNVHYWVKRQSFNAKLSFNEGYIYILENKGQPGVLKIGYTDRTPQDRVKEINSATGVITPWFIVRAFPCKAPLQIERLVHSQMSDYWLSKEGFAITIPAAEKIVMSVIEENNAFID